MKQAVSRSPSLMLSTPVPPTSTLALSQSGTPDDPAWHFATICKPGSRWHVETISAFDTPAYTGEEVPAELLPHRQSPLGHQRREGLNDVPMIIVDVVGVGAGVYDRLAELGLPVVAYNGAEAPYDKERFTNAGAEDYWNPRELFEIGEIDSTSSTTCLLRSSAH
jgi:hypothetical protein